MGLNACVYCNCYETGLCELPPPFPHLIIIRPYGYLSINTEGMTEEEDMSAYARLSEWKQVACEHVDMVVSRWRLGNVLGVAHIRSIIHKIEEVKGRSLPVLHHQVVYNGTHGGDYLHLRAVKRLKLELEFLSASEKAFLDSEDHVSLCIFLGKMYEIVETALCMGKPISF